MGLENRLETGWKITPGLEIIFCPTFHISSLVLDASVNWMSVRHSPVIESSDIHTSTSKSVFSSQISTGKTQNRPLISVGISYNFNVKITHFARNRKVKNSLRRETLVSEIPVWLILYTDTERIIQIIKIYPLLMGLENRLETGWETTPGLEIIFPILSTVQHLLPMFDIPAKRVDEVKNNDEIMWSSH